MLNLPAAAPHFPGRQFHASSRPFCRWCAFLCCLLKHCKVIDKTLPCEDGKEVDPDIYCIYIYMYNRVIYNYIYIYTYRDPTFLIVTLFVCAAPHPGSLFPTRAGLGSREGLEGTRRMGTTRDKRLAAMILLCQWPYGNVWNPEA